MTDDVIINIFNQQQHTSRVYVPMQAGKGIRLLWKPLPSVLRKVSKHASYTIYYQFCDS